MPTCAIVVSVDLDHQAFLGNDRESIGFEKAGIFRAGPARRSSATSIRPSASWSTRKRSARDLQVLGRDFRYEATSVQWDFIGRKGAKRALPMPGAARPLAAEERLRARSRPWTSSPIACRSPWAR